MPGLFEEPWGGGEGSTAFGSWDRVTATVDETSSESSVGPGPVMMSEVYRAVTQNKSYFLPKLPYETGIWSLVFGSLR